MQEIFAILQTLDKIYVSELLSNFILALTKYVNMKYVHTLNRFYSFRF